MRARGCEDPRLRRSCRCWWSLRWLPAAAWPLLLCWLLVQAGAALASASAPPPSSAACWVTFAAVDANLTLLQYRAVAFSCPPGCLELGAPASSTRFRSALVEGSFPYSASSSVCLSAVHCGLLNATLGGSVFVSRFHRQDWSNGSTQTIFPFNSSQGGYSNGVLSVDVPAASFAVPSNGSVYSFIVRGRGEVAVQRRSAPFPPRSGHVHAAFPPNYRRASRPPLPFFHTWSLIIGGYNGSEYLNDVWLAEPDAWTVTGSDISWRALALAPFSPRSDMQWTLVQGAPSGLRLQYELYIVGGQTGHACGLTELGLCSDEVWTLELTVLASDAPVNYRLLNISWTSTQPVARLPFPSRCGPSLLWFDLPIAETVVLLAGQLSYNDSSCRSPPSSVNEVWTSSGDAGQQWLNWSQQSNAPFSPRRSQQREDVLSITAPLSLWDRRQLYPLAGGLRVMELSGDVTATQLTAVEVEADVWVCFFVGDAAPVFGCGWQQAGAAAVPSTSLPIPIAFGPSASVRSVWAPAGQRFGGFTAQAAVSAWLSAVPTGADVTHSGPFNWTYLLRPVPHDSVTAADIAQQRWMLPTAFTLTDELRDPMSSYYTGTEFVSSHSPWLSPPLSLGSAADVVLPSLSTVHPQRWSSAAYPYQSSVFLPLPLSSLRTKRPLFQFELPRLSAGYDEWSNGVLDPLGNALQFTVGLKVVSGGRTGNRSSSDWITMTEVRCLPPDDPSFWTLLGRLRWWTTAQPAVKAAVQDASFPQRQRLSVACLSQFHFEPRLERADDTVLTCGPNGIWLDTDLHTTRVCVPNAPLNCTAPLVDTGQRYCQPGRPSVTRLSASGATVVDALTLLDLPVTPDNTLYVQGSNFTQPLLVTVGGLRCDWPQLTGPQRFVCYNFTCGEADTRTQVCDWFSDSLSCTLPALLGLNLPVLVTSGPSAIQAEVGVTDPTAARVARVSSTPPNVVFLLAYNDNPQEPVCNSTDADPLRLWNCPVTGLYNLSVCVDGGSVYTLALNVTLGASLMGLPCLEQDPRDLLQEIGAAVRCLRCLVTPFLGSQAVRVQPTDLPLQSRADASLSAGLCPVGYATNFTAALSGLHTPLCAECPAGTSTRGVQGLPDCLPCAVGHFAPSTGTGECRPCPPGRVSRQVGAVSCALCNVNQYQPRGGQDSCIGCDADSFVVYVNQSSRADGSCSRCPDGAVCLPEVISARSGRFVIIDQQSSALEALPCSTFACKSGGLEPCDGSDPLVLLHASLPVLNCCGPGRRPAFSSEWEADSELAKTAGVNVLCALCKAGHTQMNGVCIPCSSARWGRLTAIALLGLLLVFAVHRCSHDWSGAATMSILAYFLQQSDLFLSLGLLSTVNLDPLGAASRPVDGDDSDAGEAADWCVVPMGNDGQRLIAALLSTPVAFLLLAVVGLLHWLALQALLRSRLQADSAGAAARSGWQWLLPLYSFVFLASTPSRQARPTAAAPNSSLPMAELSQPLMSPADGMERDSEVSPVQQQQQERVEEAAQAEGSPRRAAIWVQQLRVAQALMAHCASKAAAAAPPAWLLYQRSFVRLLQLSYTAMALLTIRFFRLRPVGAYGERVVDYPGLDPASSVYRLLVPLMSLCLALVLAAPLLLCAFLIRQHRKGSIAALKAMTPSAASAAAAASRRDALLLQLCCMFRSRCWWMAGFLPLRRLLVVAVLLSAQEPQVWVWLTLCNNALLAVHLQLQPYEQQQDNALETLMLAALSLQTSLLCLFTPAAQPALFVCLVLGPVALLVAAKASSGLLRWRRVWRQHNNTRDSRSRHSMDAALLPNLDWKGPRQS